jgi:hypothetical protein
VPDEHHVDVADTGVPSEKVAREMGLPSPELVKACLVKGTYAGFVALWNREGQQLVHMPNAAVARTLLRDGLWYRVLYAMNTALPYPRT